MTEHTYIKRTLVYALLYVYSFGLLKPIVPVVNDVIAHTFYKLEHMATVHYENGKYHLHAEIASEVPDNGEPKSSSAASVYEVLANHVYTGTIKLNSELSVSQTIIHSQTQHTLDVFIKSPTPPPKA